MTARNLRGIFQASFHRVPTTDTEPPRSGLTLRPTVQGQGPTGFRSLEFRREPGAPQGSGGPDRRALPPTCSRPLRPLLRALHRSHVSCWRTLACPQLLREIVTSSIFPRKRTAHPRASFDSERSKVMRRTESQRHAVPAGGADLD